MMSATAGLNHDLTMILMTPLPDRCTPDSELLSTTTASNTTLKQFSFLIHTKHSCHKVQYIIYLTTKDKLTQHIDSYLMKSL